MCNGKKARGKWQKKYAEYSVLPREREEITPESIFAKHSYRRIHSMRLVKLRAEPFPQNIMTRMSPPRACENYVRNKAQNFPYLINLSRRNFLRAILLTIFVGLVILRN